jgi:type 1 glutamine amidotransferase
VTAKATLLILALAAALLCTASASSTTAPRGIRVLAFTRTAGFRHSSIPAAIAALRELSAQNDFELDATEDPAVFSDAGLARYDVVVFLLTTGDVLDAGRQAALEHWVASGGGWVGVHSASDTEYDWPWYGRLVGAYFLTHGAIQPATIVVAEPRDPSTRPLPGRWIRTDEWYSFRSNPRAAVRVLATIDEKSYDVGEGAMGDHPIAWSHEYAGGRAWYTAGGHTDESYAEPLFRAHLVGGIRYAAGPATPQLRGATTTVHGGRVTVTVRHAACRRCAARLRVRGRTVPMRDDGHAARTTVVLPSGRWRLTVVIENLATGRTAAVGRQVSVP